MTHSQFYLPLQMKGGNRKITSSRSCSSFFSCQKKKSFSNETSHDAMYLSIESFHFFQHPYPIWGAGKKS